MKSSTLSPHMHAGMDRKRQVRELGFLGDPWTVLKAASKRKGQLAPRGNHVPSVVARSVGPADRGPVEG